MQRADNDDVEHTEQSHRRAAHAGDAPKRPSTVLRMLMNAADSYREARKMGWARPQNTHGVTVFQSFRLDESDDRPLVHRVLATAAAEFGELRGVDLGFMAELRADPGLKAFIFVHDLEQAGRRFEGLTFSLGREAEADPRFRDRFDLILEAQVVDGRSQGLTRARCYVDPFRSPAPRSPGCTFVHEPTQAKACDELYARGKQLYAEWRTNGARHWSHWTKEYLEHFGPRKRAVVNTQFPTELDEQTPLRSA